jgi:hypothetical protein
MTAMNTPWAWRLPSLALRWARLGALIAGIAFVIYLIYTEDGAWRLVAPRRPPAPIRRQW